MAFQPATDCAEAVINATAFGKPMANVLNFHFPGGYLLGSLEDLAEMVDDMVGTYYLPLMHTAVTYQNVTVRGLSEVVDLSTVNNESAGDGTDAGVPLPSNVAFCARANTGHTGRSARGRFYSLPTSVNSLTDAVTFDVVWADALIVFLEAIRAGAGALGVEPVVLSRQNGGVVLTEAVPRTIIVWDYANLKVDSQRGRLPKPH